MLEIKNLFCERDERTLFDSLSFSLNQGEVLQIEGQNGSGKTTLLRILSGLTEAFEGDIFWQGNNIEDDRDNFYSSLLYVGHLAGVKGILTAEENLSWMAKLNPSLDRLSITEALEKIGLSGYEDVPCQTLSAGQQRRVGLARLYLSNAPLWIMDEPFTALDKKGVTEKESLIAQHVQEGGSVILTTHHTLQIPNKDIRYINLDERLVS
ncbi:MAG: cytochrome c biogenesis heme-transporting ATPase CcmA [Methylococcales bacterium]|nr:cytochrome c biogenesis heme-transporting ATPase CcmA [Methylococcales bacterium]